MLTSELLELTQQEEGAKLEFKRDDVRPETLAKEIVAFANMNGGTILVGVEDNGEISGIKRENFQAWLMDTVISKYVHPFILPNYETISIDKKTVAIITVPQGNAKPYMLKHNNREDIYVRYGDICQLADRERQARLFQSGGLISAESFPVYGSSLGELDERRYKEYFLEVLEENTISNWEQILKDRSFLIEDSGALRCSYFAYLMFAKKPQTRLTQSGVRLTVYSGTDKDYSTLYDEMLTAPLTELRSESTSALHNQIIALLRPYISKEKLQDTTRKRFWDYPKEVLREVFVNAFIHRDWTKQDYVRIIAYSNRLVIRSPGALPNGMTEEKIKNGEQTPRNPKCVRIFRDYGYMEDQGMGIRRIVIPLMKEKNESEPEFEAAENYFQVTLWKNKKNS